ncbi:MAG TPA: hypothetical protein VHZ78_03350 [Rhizomicrobium sp.]|nr:hypothetical protein [Rhizomicrobium sp.]
MTIRKLMATGAVAAVLGIGALAATTTVAEARTVCSRFGDCWQETTRYDYPATLGVRFYNDSWRHDRWHDRDSWNRYHWRDHHDGRGYWRDGVWITF